LLFIWTSQARRGRRFDLGRTWLAALVSSLFFVT
jgi:hypothetical protein